MASSLSSTPYNCVRLVHEEDGLVRFTSAIDADVTNVALKISSRSQADSTICKLFEKNLLKFEAAVFFEILWCGFKAHGAVCLDGWTQKTDPGTEQQPYFPAIRTIIQQDGDIICQISRDLLKEKNASNFIALYQQVILKFLDQFQKTMDKRARFVRRIFITIISMGCGLGVLFSVF